MLHSVEMQIIIDQELINQTVQKIKIRKYKENISVILNETSIY